MKKYQLTPEHEAQFDAWAKKWIANAMSTKAMDDVDRDVMRVAIRGLYEAANLTPPPDHRIVFVPSPLVGNVASGFAAAIWWLRRNKKTATEAATEAATRAATEDATAAATEDATEAATWDATEAATRDATRAATRQQWAISLAVKFGNSELLLSCARSAYRMCNAGNHWSGWVALVSFFRHVAKLPLDYSKWQHYEAATIHGSWRWMHPDFCIISDRPKTLKIDHLNRPHCTDGPSHEWRDGWKLYYWRGLKIPAELIERRNEMTPAEIQGIENAEHRRAAIEIYAHVHGPDRFVSDLGATLIKEDIAQGRPRRLYALGDARFIHVINGSLEPDGSRREFILGAEPTAKTPNAAIAASYGRPAKKYREAVRT